MISHRDDNKEHLAEALRQWRLGDANSQTVSSPQKKAKSSLSSTLVDLCIQAAAKALAAGNTKIFDERGDLLIEEEFFARILQVWRFHQCNQHLFSPCYARIVHN
jgi:hypothetical protein